MTAREHARRAAAFRAMNEACHAPHYVAATALLAFAILSAFDARARGLAIACAVATLGLALIRAGLHRRAEHHDLAAEYLDAAPPPRPRREVPPPPPPRVA
jgi:hypothetical protein